MKKQVIFFIILLFSINIIFSNSNSTRISEISFVGDEFVELFNPNKKNLTNSKIFDEKGNESFNTLELLKFENDSNYTLIVGSNFRENYKSFDNLSCTIYLSSGTQVSKGGLKSASEDLIIFVNNSLNFSYLKEYDFDFEENESLNFYENSSNFISQVSPCTPNIIPNYSQVEQNQSNQTPINQITSCNYEFKINPLNDVFFDKIEYSFQTNATNYSIDYFIKNYQNETKKEITTTSNSNKKQYTPKEMDLYTIHATLNVGNCSISNSSQVLFYKKEEQETLSCSDSSSSSSSSKTSVVQSFETQIIILNKKEIISGNSINLELEISKGKTTKRAIYIYLNKKKILTSYPNQNTKFKLNIPLNNYDLKQTNSLKIEGLDLLQEFEFNYSKTENEIKENKDLVISSYFQNKSNLNLSFDLSKEVTLGTCYLRIHRTKISNQLNLSSNLFFNLNKTQFDKKFDFINESQIYCSYYKTSTDTKFSYSNYVNLSSLTSNGIYFETLNSTKQLSNFNLNQNGFIPLSSKKENLILFDQKQDFLTSPVETIENFKSKQIKQKENSYLIPFGVCLTLLSFLIIIW